MEMGEIGGAGHFWRNDKRTKMGDEELKKVILLLAAGQKKVNLKEREFRAFLSEKNTERNSKKVSFLGQFGGRRVWMDDSVQDCL